MMLRNYKEDGDYDVVFVNEPIGAGEHHAISGKILGPRQQTPYGWYEYPASFECKCGFTGTRDVFEDHLSSVRTEREAQSAERAKVTEEQEAALKPFLTNEFLVVLAGAYRLYGGCRDDAWDFIDWIFELAGKPLPADLDICPAEDDEVMPELRTLVEEAAGSQDNAARFFHAMDSIKAVVEGRMARPGGPGCMFPHCSCNSPWVKCELKVSSAPT